MSKQHDSQPPLPPVILMPTTNSISFQLVNTNPFLMDEEVALLIGRSLQPTAVLTSSDQPALTGSEPKWTATPRGHLRYCDRTVADIRYKAATPERIQFMLRALNAAEEKL